MLVKALRAGYHGEYREKGDVFEVPDDTVIPKSKSWIEPVDAPKKPGRKPTAAKPE